MPFFDSVPKPRQYSNAEPVSSLLKKLSTGQCSDNIVLCVETAADASLIAASIKSIAFPTNAEILIGDVGETALVEIADSLSTSSKSAKLTITLQGLRDPISLQVMQKFTAALLSETCAKDLNLVFPNRPLPTNSLKELTKESNALKYSENLQLTFAVEGSSNIKEGFSLNWRSGNKAQKIKVTLICFAITPKEEKTMLDMLKVNLFKLNIIPLAESYETYSNKIPTLTPSASAERLGDSAKTPLGSVTPSSSFNSVGDFKSSSSTSALSDKAGDPLQENKVPFGELGAYMRRNLVLLQHPSWGKQLLAVCEQYDLKTPEFESMVKTLCPTDNGVSPTIFTERLRAEQRVTGPTELRIFVQDIARQFADKPITAATLQ